MAEHEAAAPSAAVGEAGAPSTVEASGSGAGITTIPSELVEGITSSTDPKHLARSILDLKNFLAQSATQVSVDLVPRPVVAKLVQILGESSDRREVQLSTAWILTKLTATCPELTGLVVTEGLVPHLIEHLANDAFEELRVQCVWILGNIAGDSPLRRDIVLQAGVLPHLLHLISQDTRFKRHDNVTQVLKIQAVRLSVWCLSNLCRGRPGPPPNFATLLPCLPVLARMLQAQDKEILRDSCFAFANLSDGTHEKIQSVINSGVVGRLVALMDHPSKMVVASALRAVGNLLLGDDHQTQVVIDAGGLPALLSLLLHDSEHVRRDACRAVSNITAGNSDQIQAVVTAGLFPVLIALMQTPTTAGVDVEAGWAVLNVAKRGTREQMEALREMGCDPRLFTLTQPSGPSRPSSRRHASHGGGHGANAHQFYHQQHHLNIQTFFQHQPQMAAQPHLNQPANQHTLATYQPLFTNHNSRRPNGGGYQPAAMSPLAIMNSATAAPINHHGNASGPTSAALIPTAAAAAAAAITSAASAAATSSSDSSAMLVTAAASFVSNNTTFHSALSENSVNSVSSGSAPLSLSNSASAAASHAVSTVLSPAQSDAATLDDEEEPMSIDEEIEEEEEEEVGAGDEIYDADELD